VGALSEERLAEVLDAHFPPEPAADDVDEADQVDTTGEVDTTDETPEAPTTDTHENAPDDAIELPADSTPAAGEQR
jgi:hypothetical protein